jgi:hypothetical protein
VGGKKSLVVVVVVVVVAGLSWSKLMGFVQPATVEILNFVNLGPLKSCGDRMHASHAYTLRKTSRMLIWGSYRSQHGGQILSYL